MDKNIINAYENAREVYSGYGIDTDKVLERFEQSPISVPSRCSTARPSRSPRSS